MEELSSPLQYRRLDPNVTMVLNASGHRVTTMSEVLDRMGGAIAWLWQLTRYQSTEPAPLLLIFLALLDQATQASTQLIPQLRLQKPLLLLELMPISANLQMPDLDFIGQGSCRMKF